MVTEPQRIAAVSLTHRVAEKRGCPPLAPRGALWGTWSATTGGHLPSCQIIYMTIGILLKMLVSDRGGVAAAVADDVNDGGLSYGNNNDDFDDKE